MPGIIPKHLQISPQFACMQTDGSVITRCSLKCKLPYILHETKTVQKRFNLTNVKLNKNGEKWNVFIEIKIARVKDKKAWNCSNHLFPWQTKNNLSMRIEFLIKLTFKLTHKSCKEVVCLPFIFHRKRLSS